MHEDGDGCVDLPSGDPGGDTSGVGAGPIPETPDQLHGWINEWLGLEIPTRALLDGHDAPFDYLCHAFFDGGWDPATGVVCAPEGPGQDPVVWANRGGGKTFLAAVATLLDLVFKPTIEVRVLAGSLDQAKRMHAHLRGLIEGSDLHRAVDGRITEKRLRLTNGSNVELLAQSQRSVRGTRVQKLRCDEVELFDADVWEAAQLTTRSKQCGGVWVPGTIECLSTMHVPYGLMYRLVRDAQRSGTGDPAPGEDETAGEIAQDRPARRLFKWGVIDVLGECGPEHDCASCALHAECGGRAKRRDEDGETAGHMEVSDAVRLRSRVGEGTWQAEMLCIRPRRDDCVLPEFDRGRHVFGGAWTPGEQSVWIGGMDFGIRAPTVVLWAVVDSAGVVRVVGERVVAGEVIGRHAEAILSGGSGALAPFPVPEWLGVDPAGRQRSEQTGVSTVEALRKSGLVIRDRRLGVNAGLDMLRARLRPASGPPTLLVHASCARLIESLERYRYPSDQPECTAPVKDGSDHAVDALRYMVQNLDAGYRTAKGRYV